MLDDKQRDAKSESTPRRSRGELAVLMTGAAILLAVASGLYLWRHRNVTTDNAYLRVANVQISSNLSGQVVAVEVRNNQRVHGGELLLRLDDRQQQAALKKAQANLALAKLQAQTVRSLYAQRLIQLWAAKEKLSYLTKQFAREQQLAQQGMSFAAQLERSQLSRDETKASVESLESEVAGLLENIGGSVDRPIADYAAVQLAQAEVELAATQLEFTRITAPFSGTIAKADSVQVGTNVIAARPLFALYSDTDVWIEANFTERQTAEIHVNQEANVTIDRYPETNFRARVVGISPGTGASLSVLPSENAAGNWVKVAQRLPIKLRIEDLPSTMLADGLSAVVTIRRASTQSARSD